MTGIVTSAEDSKMVKTLPLVSKTFIVCEGREIHKYLITKQCDKSYKEDEGTAYW